MHDQFAELVVIGLFEPVLDDDRAPERIGPEHVEGSVDLVIALHRRDVDAERLAKQVDVLDEPAGQVRKLLTPERPQVEPLEAAEAQPLHFHSGRHPTPLRRPLEGKLYPVLLVRRQTRRVARATRRPGTAQAGASQTVASGGSVTLAEAG